MKTLHTASPADLILCRRMDALRILPFEHAEALASEPVLPAEWWEVMEWLECAEAEALDDGFSAGFVEASASPLEKLLMVAAMVVSVPLLAWWVGAWVVGVVEGRL